METTGLDKLYFETIFGYLKYIKKHKANVPNKEAVLCNCLDLAIHIAESENSEEMVNRYMNAKGLRGLLEMNFVDRINMIYKYTVGKNIPEICILNAIMEKVSGLIKYEENEKCDSRSVMLLRFINSYLRTPGVYEKLIKQHENVEETSLHNYLYQRIYIIVKSYVNYNLASTKDISCEFKSELRQLVLLVAVQSIKTGKKSMHYVAYEMFVQNIRELWNRNLVVDDEIHEKIYYLIGDINNIGVD